jgi:hypothetical protein
MKQKSSRPSRLSRCAKVEQTLEDSSCQQSSKDDDFGGNEDDDDFDEDADSNRHRRQSRASSASKCRSTAIEELPTRPTSKVVSVMDDEDDEELDNKAVAGDASKLASDTLHLDESDVVSKRPTRLASSRVVYTVDEQLIDEDNDWDSSAELKDTNESGESSYQHFNSKKAALRASTARPITVDDANGQSSAEEVDNASQVANERKSTKAKERQAVMERKTAPRKKSHKEASKPAKRATTDKTNSKTKRSASESDEEDALDHFGSIEDEGSDDDYQPARGKKPNKVSMISNDKIESAETSQRKKADGSLVRSVLDSDDEEHDDHQSSDSEEKGRIAQPSRIKRHSRRSLPSAIDYVGVLGSSFGGDLSGAPLENRHTKGNNNAANGSKGRESSVATKRKRHSPYDSGNEEDIANSVKRFRAEANDALDDEKDLNFESKPSYQSSPTISFLSNRKWKSPKTARRASPAKKVIDLTSDNDFAFLRDCKEDHKE